MANTGYVLEQCLSSTKLMLAINPQKLAIKKKRYAIISYSLRSKFTPIGEWL